MRRCRRTIGWWCGNVKREYDRRSKKLPPPSRALQGGGCEGDGGNDSRFTMLDPIPTLAGRRWGPAVAGWLSGLPIVAGPILFFISIEQGPEFGAAAAKGTLSGLVAVLAFIVGYAWSATRRSWLVSALMGWFAYAGAVGLIYVLEPPLVVSAVVDVMALWYAPGLLPKIGAPAIVAQRDYSEIAVR